MNKINYDKKIMNKILSKINNGCNILILTNNDWSNTGYRFMKSLETVNVKSILIKLHNHIFKYPEQGIICNVKNTLLNRYPIIININNKNFINFILYICKKVKFIWCHASTIFYFKNKPIYKYIKDKIFIVSHGGTTYRENPIAVGNFFNKFVSKTLIQCPDLLDLNMYNKYEKLIYYPIDLSMFKVNFNFKHENKLVFGHCPSTSKIKGTAKILEVLRSFKDQLIYIGQTKQYMNHNSEKERVTWKEQILKYQKFDIYIETLNLSINGKPYGEWGNTCLEAIASGCIVITNCLNLNKYIKYYHHNPPLIIANSGDELHKQINKLINMNRYEIIQLKKKQYEWIKNYHSLEKCGQRLLKFLNNEL